MGADVAQEERTGVDELRGGGFAAAGGVAQLFALFLSEGDSISICHAHFSREKQAKVVRIFNCYRILAQDPIKYSLASPYPTGIWSG